MSCWAAESLGTRVPRADFDACVHSVFDAACNLRIDADRSFVTLLAPGIGRSATTVRLAAVAGSLHMHWVRGERLQCRSGVLAAPHVRVVLRDAAAWYAPALPTPLPDRCIGSNLAFAKARLALRRGAGLDVLDHEAAPTIASLEDCCAALDSAAASRHAHRLVGWGEGLTPAGDDFLAGLLAGLDTRQNPERAAFRDALARSIRASLHRTVPLSAHLLDLAADGDAAEPLCLLRNALIGDSDVKRVAAALDDALAVGATSGADAVSGLLAGIASSWNAAPVLH